MLSSRYLIIPFALQMVVMAVDELYFHRKRSLPRWERMGHPLDTLTVLACFALLLLMPPRPSSIMVYAGLCIFSCLFVTKDEKVHLRYCNAGEQWVHALLFILHPFVLLSAGLLWPALQESPGAAPWIRYEGFEKIFLPGIAGLTALFALYQLIYWNFIWQAKSANT